MPKKPANLKKRGAAPKGAVRPDGAAKRMRKAGPGVVATGKAVARARAAKAKADAKAKKAEAKAKADAKKRATAAKAKEAAKVKALAKRAREKAAKAVKRERAREHRREMRERAKERAYIREAREWDRAYRREADAKARADAREKAKAERDAAKAAKRKPRFRFVRRPEESDAEAEERRVREKRAYHNFKKRVARLSQEERKYAEIEAECRHKYLRNHIPDWIMDDAVAEAVWALWRRDQTVGEWRRRKEARKGAYKAWRALCEGTRLREDLLEVARKWGVGMTRREAGELMAHFDSVTAAARDLFLESGRHLSEFGLTRIESDVEVYDRLIAESGRGHATHDPLDELEAASAVEQLDKLLTPREREVFAGLRAGDRQEAIRRRLGLTKGRISQLVASAREKVAAHFDLPLDQCHFDAPRRERDNFKAHTLERLAALRENRRTDTDPVLVSVTWIDPVSGKKTTWAGKDAAHIQSPRWRYVKRFEIDPDAPPITKDKAPKKAARPPNSPDPAARK